MSGQLRKGVQRGAARERPAGRAAREPPAGSCKRAPGGELQESAPADNSPTGALHQPIEDIDGRRVGLLLASSYRLEDETAVTDRPAYIC